MHEPQFITAPGGARLVVLPEADYLALIAAREDAADEAAAAEGLDSLSREGGIPADVLYAIQDGANPVAAWRQWHGLSQSELALRAGLTQAAIARIESAKPGAGRPDTRRAIAAALGAPLWAIDGKF